MEVTWDQVYCEVKLEQGIWLSSLARLIPGLPRRQAEFQGTETFTATGLFLPVPTRSLLCETELRKHRDGAMRAPSAAPPHYYLLCQASFLLGIEGTGLFHLFWEGEKAMHSFLMAEREYGYYLGLSAKRLKIQIQESDPALATRSSEGFLRQRSDPVHVSAGCLTDHLYFAISMNKKACPLGFPEHQDFSKF